MDEMIDIVDDQGAEIIQLARALQHPAPRSGSGRRRRIIPVTKSAVSAAGTASVALNARIVHEAAEAIVGPDIPATEAAEIAIAMLKEIGPRDVRESLIARRLVMIDALAVETLELAKASTAHPMLRDAYAAQACALSKAATELDEALERRRVGKQEQRVVVQHIRGGQVVGMVNK
jgi:hypothetical protein